MIYTVTCNPAIDYIIRLDDFKQGKINRVNSEKVLGGGKGINVSIVLSNLGIRSTALGFLSGFTGEEIRRQIKEHSITMAFVELPVGFTRINVKIKRQDEETEINGGGPKISAANLEELYARFGPLTQGDYLVLSGSVPSGCPETIYEEICRRVKQAGVRVIVDAEKKLLLPALKEKPFLVKPNREELAEIFGADLKTDADISRRAQELQAMGASNVLVSLGADGAFLLTEEGKTYRASAKKGKVKGSVGAGDSMIAGFLAALSQNGNMEAAFKMGIAAGSASAFSENLATGEEVEALLD